MELPICPACNEQLEPGKHHNKCKAGRTTNPPSKRAPKASAAGNRSTKSTRHAVVSKRLVAREQAGMDAAACTQRKDVEENMGVAPSKTAHCDAQSRIDYVEVAEGAFMARPLTQSNLTDLLFSSRAPGHALCVPILTAQLSLFSFLQMPQVFACHPQQGGSAGGQQPQVRGTDFSLASVQPYWGFVVTSLACSSNTCILAGCAWFPSV